MTVQIVEVLRRSDQGMTKPYICRADNGEIYFVKGIGSTRRSQVLEWIAGNLGLELGLNIAPFEIVDVPDELFENSFGLNLSDLGMGPAFGSCKQTIMELNYAVIDEIPPEVQMNVLAFDWWIRNGDRMLTEHGGNPNLFWAPDTKLLVVIDHNQAFAEDFSEQDFFDYHVFNGQARGLFSDWELKNTYAQKFRDALRNWKAICDRIPEEWFYADQEMTVAAKFDLDEIFEMLNRYTQEDFWNTP